MQTELTYGRDRLTLELRAGQAIAAGPAADPAGVAPRAAVRAALEHPTRFVPLRRALTPDDRLTIVLDEELPRLGDLLAGLLDHVVTGAGVTPTAVTLLCAPPAERQAWVDDLPDEFQDVRIEVHDPTDRKRLAYLATTRGGRRIYLNRTTVDADQVVILTGRRYDPLFGYAGAETAVFPALGDKAVRELLAPDDRADHSGDPDRPLRREAGEVTDLLGSAFLVQAIEGAGDSVQQVLAGQMGISAEGRAALDARWRVRVAEPVETVVATLSGDPARHDFAALARAAARAARVVAADGRIVLLTQAAPELGDGADLIGEADGPAAALELLAARRPHDRAARAWAEAARQARLYLLSGLPGDAVEELFATPVEQPRQVQRLLDAGGECLVLPDAHKMLAEIIPG